MKKANFRFAAVRAAIVNIQLSSHVPPSVPNTGSISSITIAHRQKISAQK
jgi:hypothetical protein